ncbi:MAG: hemolysin family protein [Treponemataceae bacterium]|nr:hemolysin family protein [Treponemataceae bacterium]
MSLAISLVTLVFLVVMSAFFSSSETAFLSLSKIKMRQMLKENKKAATPVAKLKQNTDNLLTLILVGNNFVNTFASSLATSVALGFFGESGVGIATAVMTVLIIIFGEILPKSFAANNPEKLSIFLAKPLSLLKIILKPITFIFSAFSKMISKFVETFQKNPLPSVTEEELKTLIEVGDEEGTLEDGEKEMLYKIFEFTDLRVRDILRHRSFVKAIDSKANYEETLSKFIESGYSRLPVFKDDLETILGTIHYKDVLYFSGSKLNFTAEKIVRKALFIPETISVVTLLMRFRTEKHTFAVVVSEHGNVEGIVTADDALKAVFGRITDEYNSKSISPEERIRVTGKREFLIPGDMFLNDVNRIFSTDLESEDFDSLGGWLLEQFGYLPENGEKLKIGSTTFTVEDVGSRRIQSIRMRYER